MELHLNIPLVGVLLQPPNLQKVDYVAHCIMRMLNIVLGERQKIAQFFLLGRKRTVARSLRTCGVFVPIWHVVACDGTSEWIS